MFCRLGLDLQEHLRRPVTLVCQQPLVHPAAAVQRTGSSDSEKYKNDIEGRTENG